MTAVERSDRLVLLGLQALVLGVPLMLGGMHDETLRLTCPLVLVLLAVTVWRRRQVPDAPGAPGVGILTAFMALGIVTSLPVPPAVIASLAPNTEQLYRTMLPGWPVGGGWSGWRSIAIDPWAVWIELLRFAIGFGAYSVMVAYPWAETRRGQAGRDRAFNVLFLTLLAGGVLFALLGFAQEAAGNGQVLWIWPAAATRGRLAGPFVNPNHFAAWLEMALPAVVAYCITLGGQLRGRLRDAAESGRVVGVRARRAWAAALIANQRRLWMPLAVVAAAVIMLAAHLATDSRGGRAALLAGAALLGLGVVAQSRLPWRDVVRRHSVALALALLVTTAGAFMTLGSTAGGPEASATFEEADVDTGMRLTVARYGVSVFRDHLLLGTGLGSWIHAFRPYQKPPVEDGIWDHAHNDYVELGAESGLIGLGLAALFAFAVARSSRRDITEVRSDGKRSRRYGGGGIIEEGDWRAGLRHTGLLRWGLAAGVLAILVHSFVDFSLRMPANLLALMVILGLLGLTGRERPRVRRAPAPALLFAVIALAAAPPVMNGVIIARGGTPLSPDDALDAADALFAENDDAVGAAKMVRVAIDRSPANRETHEALSEILRPGEESEAALRRALALEPWAAEVRDNLGLHLWERGDAVRAAAELEESMFRYPHLETHAYLDPDSGVFAPRTAEQLRRQLVEGETLKGRLAVLPAEMADAIERGLRRALQDESMDLDRAAVAQDVITLLEARGRWAEAAGTLRTQGEQRLDDSELLARAARNFLKVHDYGAAEETLLTAITRTPEEGILYRELAVDVYAMQGDFTRAETILDAGERNAIDLVPVYRGVTEVLARREAQHPVLTPDAKEDTAETLGEGSDGE